MYSTMLFLQEMQMIGGTWGQYPGAKKPAANGCIFSAPPVTI